MEGDTGLVGDIGVADGAGAGVSKLKNDSLGLEGPGAATEMGVMGTDEGSSPT